MRPRRHALQVSTFPFLAVLLCAMGSLILLLLVIDRRAKSVARAKAMQLVEHRAAEAVEAAARHHQEMEQRRQVLHGELRSRALEALNRLQAVRTEAAAAANDAKAEVARRAPLQQKIDTLAAHISAKQNIVKTRQTEIGDAANRIQENERERTRMTEELVRFEKTMADLRAARAHDEQTYSLVPYRGKRGDNRRPLYVECNATNLTCHPDRPEMDVVDLRSEIESRIATRRSSDPVGSAGDTPYVLFLVRPAGIVTYYRAMAALEGMKLEFGYEFVEADWVFDFSDKDEAPPQPGMGGARPLVAATKQPPPKEPSTVSESAPTPRAEPMADQHGWNPRGTPANIGRPSGESVTTRPQPGSGAPTPIANAGTYPALPPLQDANGASGLGNGTTTTSTQISTGTATERNRGPVIGASQPALMHTDNRTSVGVPKPESVPNHSGGPSISNNQTSLSALPSGAARPDGDSPRVTDSERQGAGPLTPIAESRSPAGTRMVRIPPSRDWVIAVECTSNGIIVAPGAIPFSFDAIAADRAENPLKQTLQQMIARRQSMAKPGEPGDRPVIHFRIRPDGLRAYYLAYPVLESLRVPMTRENLRPEVGRRQHPAGAP